MLILASSSPRRRELLTQAGLTFGIHAADIDETPRPGEPAPEFVQRLALEKALTVLPLYPGATILGADTTVAIDNQILNKPDDTADAERMLRLLSGRTHQCYTGVAVVTATARTVHVETTHVTFSEIRAEDLAHYLTSGGPLGKAGAYGIQGYAARWIPRIEGDYFNVVGLPISATIRLLSELEQLP